MEAFKQKNILMGMMDQAGAYLTDQVRSEMIQQASGSRVPVREILNQVPNVKAGFNPEMGRKAVDLLQGNQGLLRSNATGFARFAASAGSFVAQSGRNLINKAVDTAVSVRQSLPVLTAGAVAMAETVGSGALSVCTSPVVVALAVGAAGCALGVGLDQLQKTCGMKTTVGEHVGDLLFEKAGPAPKWMMEMFG